MEKVLDDIKLEEERKEQEKEDEAERIRDE